MFLNVAYANLTVQTTHRYMIRSPEKFTLIGDDFHRSPVSYFYEATVTIEGSPGNLTLSPGLRFSEFNLFLKKTFTSRS